MIASHEEEKYVGIDLPELIRLKRRLTYWPNNRSCSPDWSAWIDTIETFQFVQWISLTYHRRDWSAWIDTIETSLFCLLIFPVISWSGLICLNWYDWNASSSNAFSHSSSGRDWSAWIDTIETLSLTFVQHTLLMVGIDLPELIRLKQFQGNNWLLFLDQVGIDLPELIRLKQS